MAMAQAIRHDLRNRLTELYGPRIDRLLLFGSQARGDAVEGSDVDVLVVLHGEVQPGEEIRRTGGTLNAWLGPILLCVAIVLALSGRPKKALLDGDGRGVNTL